MSYRWVLIICLLIMGCNNNIKKESKDDKMNSNNPNDSAYSVVKEVSIDGIDQWEFRGIEMLKTDMIFNDKEVYKITVIDHIETYTFVAINNVKIAYTGGKYRISLIVKPNKEKSNFGIRIQEVYPTRFDVVFDFFNEKVRGTFKNGDFTEAEVASIELLEEGWYKCTIEAEINASYFRLLFGPSDVLEQQTRSWESELLNNKEREILIIPSSVKVEELND